MQAVLDCRKLEDGVRRLTCYDDAVARMAAAQASGDLIALDHDQRRTLSREAFGLNLPALSMFDQAGKTDAIEQVVGKVATASRDAAGRWRLVLDDRALWAQTDDTDLDPIPQRGSNAVIRRGALGSFFMTIDGGPEIRAQRQN